MTIKDVELAGLIINWLVLDITHLPLQLEQIGTFCDNTSAVSWKHKIRFPASIEAGTLIRMLSICIHARKASSITPLHVAGKDSKMADIVSRAFKEGK